MSVIYINSYQFAAAEPTDPYFNNVSLLLHGDGTNGSTTITDSSSSPKTVTAVGNAQISTAQSKFGGASIAFDGNGDYLALNGESDFSFGTGDFTIELWAFAPNPNPLQVLVDFRPTGTQGFFPVIYIESNYLKVYINNGTRITGTVALAANTWTFIALSRSGSSIRLFQNGTQAGATYSSSDSYSVGATRPVIGAEGFSLSKQFFNGYIDDIRITKGIARYTSNFTPPTAPFPNA